MKRFAVAAGAVGAIGVLATGLATTAQAQDSPHTEAECTAHELPLPNDIGADASVRVVSADPSGRYVLGYVSGAPNHPEGDGLLWVDGEFETRLAGDSASEPDTYANFDAVNGSGVVVGVTEIGNADSVPWKYENGETTALPGANWLEDINENGDILGSISNERTMIWLGGDPDDRHELQGDVIATEISDHGFVVGSDYDYDVGGEVPYYWPDPNSDVRRLKTPAGVQQVSWPLRVTGDWAISNDGDADDVGIRWNLADGTVEALPHLAMAVNGHGDIGAPGVIHRTDDSRLDLPAPGGSDATPYVVEVTERDSEYAAAGNYEVADDIYRPLTWIC